MKGLKEVNIQLINVNECEQESACWCEYLIIDYQSNLIAYYWASEASPTLGCSIEILRDICWYVCMSVCLQKIRMSKCVGGITCPKHTHAQSQFWAVKTDP